jgi:GNAT superfamily N-acetyltransferase
MSVRSGMLTIQRVDPANRTQVRQFVDVPFALYRGNPSWVPPLGGEAAVMLDRRRHPFYEHSDADFFVARRDDRPVGRIAALELRPYNRAHDVRQVSFALFDCEDDPETAGALLDRVFEWGRARGLTSVVGPRGLGALDGYGALVEGFDRRQLMTMTSYNGPWYARLLEGLGFHKEVDFVTFELRPGTFVMPEPVRRAAERASAELRVMRFPTKRALLRAARRIRETYNRAFTGNWEYYPLTDREIDFLVAQVRPLVDPRLMTLIGAGDEIVGFLLAFPDVSAALQAAGGRLTPWSLVRLLTERRRTKTIALNGAGILPEYQGRGGNALLYTEIERAIRAGGFERAELPQVAESAVKMRRDLEKLGARPIKTHRVYRRDI